MSAIMTTINNYFDNSIGSFFRISQNYMKRRNPLLNMVQNTLASVQTFLSTKQRLKALKYRVQLMNYRIYQMEQVIQQNNPHNFKGGSTLNHLR